MIKLENFLNPNLKSFWSNSTGYDRLSPARYRVLYGGRASSKSHEFCTMLVALSFLNNKRILCTRAYQNKIGDSVMNLLVSKIEALGLGAHYKVTKNSIICTANGSQFLFYGLARSTAEIKGLENIDICYVEEGQYITKEMFDTLTPTIRANDSELWIAFNPNQRTDYVYSRFVLNTPQNAISRLINYTDNPMLPNVIKEDIELFKEDEDFDNIYLGSPRDGAKNPIFKFSWLESCIDAFTKLGVDKPVDINTIGYDVADAGVDTNVTARNVGNEIVNIDEWRGKPNELDVSAKRAIRRASYDTVLFYDGIGVGAGTKAFLKDSIAKKEIRRVDAFIASNSPTDPNKTYTVLGKASDIKNKDYFQNAKAQQWVYLRDRVVATYNAIENGKEIKREDIVSFSNKLDRKILDKVFEELCTPSLEIAVERKVKVESKKDLAKRGIKSHNIADAIIMSFIKKRKIF